MKKFLFTLAALLMAGSLFAQECYLYVDDFEVSQELLAQTSAKKRRVTVSVKADFPAYVTAWQIRWTLPEHVSLYALATGTTYDLTYMDKMEQDITFTPGLSVDYNNQTAIAAVLLEQGYYYEEGMDPDEDDPVTYGNPKWLGQYEDYLQMTLQFDQEFTGGDLNLQTEPSSTPDPRGPVVVEGQVIVKVCHITVESAAPEPTISMNSTYEVSAVCADHEVVLMINGEEVENPYQIEQTYEEQTITFTAYTVANDGELNSNVVTQQFTVPAKEKDYAPAPTFREAGGKVYAECDGYTVVMMLDGDVCENPYTLPEPIYGEAQTFDFTAYTVKNNEYYNSETVRYETTVAAKPYETLQGILTIGEVNQENGQFTVTYTGTENVTITCDMEAVRAANTFTLPGYGTYHVTAKATANGAVYNGDYITAEADLTWNEPAPELPAAPEITIGTEDAYITIGATEVAGAEVVLYEVTYDEETGEEIRTVIDNPSTYQREGENYTVYVVAVATNEAGSTESVVTPVIVPAKAVDPETAINEMMGGKTIANVRYFNMAGQEMQEANGMTIVVTTYTDGTTSAVKVMK